MQAAQVLAGYTLGGADLLRRAMGKKKAGGNGQAAREFSSRAAPSVNNIPAAKANQIFDLLEKFAGYGFNKSHAAAYAIVAYQTAWLKANYPVEFLSAMMTNDMGDTAKLGILIGEARQFDIEVLPPDVNESGVFFTPSRRPGGAGPGHSFRPGRHQGRRAGGGGEHSGGAAGRQIHARCPNCASGWTAALSTAKCWRP